jgi:hypothetical protein
MNVLDCGSNCNFAQISFFGFTHSIGQWFPNLLSLPLKYKIILAPYTILH